MSERYVVPEQRAAEREFVPATAWWNFEPKFNVSPGQYVPAMRMFQGRSEGVMLRWGVIPSWLEVEPQGAVNASVRRCEIDRSAVYKSPWHSGQRCIVAVAGFYTWHLTRQGHRQPYYVRLLGRAVFGVAALWDRWVSETDDVIESCAWVCVPANELLASVGAGGMPAILRRKDYQRWLAGTPAEAATALEPYKAQWMQADPVSPRVNSCAVDGPALIRMAS